MKYFVYFLLAILGMLAFRNGGSLIRSYAALHILKEDLAEINRVNYGLFNMQLWKKEAMRVFENRIGQFEISEKAYSQVEKELEKYLHGINKEYIESGKIFTNIFADAEKNPSVNKVFLKLIKDNTAPQIKNLEIKRYIPGMAVQLADELKKQEPQLRDIMRNELKKILTDTDSTTINDPREMIYSKYGVTEQKAATELLNEKISVIKSDIEKDVQFVFWIGIAGFLLFWALFMYNGYLSNITSMTFISVVMLILGVSLPMIDLEALLNAFEINIIGTTIGFDKQYIYYQSKSILDVTETLISSGGIDLKIVGYMVLCFSVLFPFVKLILTVLYLFSSQIRDNRWVQNIIFYLGKWSMADVFVVALFMAYIGFYGILNSQLQAIENNKGGFAVETINNSSLSPGALFFTSYCIMSIILGIVVNKRISKIE
ncbi:MAG: paraquat-inducible protein A [Saprospiraceae bacterium]|nr:paraquat-inducible protein A [Saprospiraceae bacterium]